MKKIYTIITSALLLSSSAYAQTYSLKYHQNWNSQVIQTELTLEGLDQENNVYFRIKKTDFSAGNAITYILEKRNVNNQVSWTKNVSSNYNIPINGLISNNRLVRRSYIKNFFYNSLTGNLLDSLDYINNHPLFVTQHFNGDILLHNYGIVRRKINNAYNTIWSLNGSGLSEGLSPGEEHYNYRFFGDFSFGATVYKTNGANNGAVFKQNLINGQSFLYLYFTDQNSSGVSIRNSMFYKDSLLLLTNGQNQFGYVKLDTDEENFTVLQENKQMYMESDWQFIYVYDPSNNTITKRKFINGTLEVLQSKFIGSSIYPINYSESVPPAPHEQIKSFYANDANLGNKRFFGLEDGFAIYDVNFRAIQFYNSNLENIFSYVISDSPVEKVTISKSDRGCIAVSSIYTNTGIKNSQIHVFCTETASTNELETTNFTLYPNPTNSEIIIQFEETNSVPSIVRLLDLTGKEVLQQNTNSALELTLDVRKLAPGTYLLHAGNGVKKVVIE